MPNHITSKLEIHSTEDVLKSILDKYSTFFPSVLNKTYDGEKIICIHKDDKYNVGWYNEETKVFSRRDKEDVIGMPDGYEKDYTEAWTRFPDFEKVFPSPEIIQKVGEVSSEIVTAVKAKYMANVSSHPLVAGLELMNRSSAKTCFDNPQKQERFELSCKAYEETGFAYWYDWQIEHWGTKWNAYSCKKLSDNIFQFDTAWSGVPGIIQEISKQFPEAEFKYKYADEDSGCNTGEFTIRNGLIEKEYKPENQSMDAWSIYFEINPDDKECYQLNGNTYEYIEEEY